jgi:hypothetical protein|tara:strand:+ start:162 stop:464 length:303 start_codon:yes stop_codon:yes gene_type:complete
MIFYDITQAIVAIKSDAQVSVKGDDINQITWHDDNPTNITNAQILEKQVELKAAHNAKSYSRNREAEYPSIVDQLDKIYHNGLDEWKKVIKVIKDKYPKE